MGAAVMSVDEEAFKTNLQSMFIYSNAEASAKAVFDQYDTNNDGLLDEAEFSKLCYDVGSPLTLEEAHAAIKVIDENCDGNITCDEFMAWWRSSSNFFRYDEQKFAIAQFAIGLFRFYDEPRVGYITKDQFDEGCRLLAESENPAYEPWAQRAFEEYDCVNEDGWVTMNEFMHYILTAYFPDHVEVEAAKAH